MASKTSDSTGKPGCAVGLDQSDAYRGWFGNIWGLVHTHIALH